MFTLGAFAVILDERGQVLLCHRRDFDAWNLPGGGVDEGELPTEAVVREVREETELQVTVERLVGVYSKGTGADLAFIFTCRVIGGQLSRTAEARECRYFDAAEMPLNTIPKHLERIQDALNGGDQPLFRRQIS